MQTLDRALLLRLRDHGPSSPRVLAFHLKRSGAHVRQRLSTLARAGLARKVDRGLYALDERRFGAFLREEESRRNLLHGLERYEPWQRALLGWEMGLLNPTNPAYGRRTRS